MTKVTIANKELELVVEDQVAKKAKDLNIETKDIVEMLERNQEQLQDADENEEVLLMGKYSLVLFKTADQIKVANLIGKENVH